MKAFIVALFVISTSLVFSQDWKNQVGMARKAFQKKDYAEALKYYKSAQKLAPNDVDLSIELAQTAYRLNAYDKAEDFYKKAVKKEKNKDRKVTLFDNLGRSQLKQKKYKEAEESFKSALRMDPNNEKAQQGLMACKVRPPKEKQSQQLQQNKTKQQQQKEAEKQNDKEKQEEQKLKDKETDRKLDDLTKKEIQTKKRLDASKDKTNEKSALKDW